MLADLVYSQRIKFDDSASVPEDPLVPPDCVCTQKSSTTADDTNPDQKFLILIPEVSSLHTPHLPSASTIITTYLRSHNQYYLCLNPPGIYVLWLNEICLWKHNGLNESSCSIVGRQYGYMQACMAVMLGILGGEGRVCGWSPQGGLSSIGLDGPVQLTVVSSLIFWVWQRIR